MRAEYHEFNPQKEREWMQAEGITLNDLLRCKQPGTAPQRNTVKGD